MIKKLQKRFIALSMITLFILLTAIIFCMNVLNYNSIIKESDQTLTLIATNRGIFPEMDGIIKPPNMSPEAPYETRYFSVLFSEDERVLYVDTGKIKAITPLQAIDYAINVRNNNKHQGFFENYRYLCSTEGKTLRIIFLDCGRKLESYHTFLIISTWIAFAGFILFFFVVLFFSNRIIQPVAQSYEKQKRFITDAGHEIKTPLSIIKADIEVLEIELGENEWTHDIQKQTERLSSLTNDLVYLSKMEESNNTVEMIEFPFSDIVYEIAISFQNLAKAQNKEFIFSIQPMLSFTGNLKSIDHLIHILLDNALKYSPENSKITLSLKKQNKSLLLSIHNFTTQPISKDKVNLIFDRFYRIDDSRNSETGGHGIGLSIAKAIVETHKGRIEAKTDNEFSLMILVHLPINL